MNEATRVLERLSAIAEEWKLANLRPQIAACRALTQANDRIDVAVLGRFKAGKSLFPNALADGLNPLPAGAAEPPTSSRLNGTNG